MKRLARLRLNPKRLEIVFFLVIFSLSLFLFTKTFKINSLGNLEVATKAWSDFSATIPLIRSFSLGSNFPPQYPLFAGPPIRYHFGFFAGVGFLEKLGIPLDWALNIPSALSLTFLIALVYLLGKKVFKKRTVGVVAVFLFLFNSSLSFLAYFKTHPLSVNTLNDIVKNSDFASFGPYDGSIISAFWSLNVFTNQRHLALAYAAFLALSYLIFRYAEGKSELTYSKSILFGILIGFFPFFHLAVFGMLGIALIAFFFIYPKLRKQVFLIAIIAAAIALPQLLLLKQTNLDLQFFYPGYLIENLTLMSFIEYWIANLGLTLILAPLGFLLAKKKQRKIFIPFIALFVVGNLFKFSVEISANHKFFNLFVIGANLFTAYFLVYLWNKLPRDKQSLRLGLKKPRFSGILNTIPIGRILVPIFFMILTLSGIIDLFPIINDNYIEIKDQKNKAKNFIIENTPPDSIFLNSSFLYDAASLAGRKIYLGWPYFSWSAGYDTNTRYANLQKYLLPSDIGELCSSLYQEQIDYVEIQKPTPLEDTMIDYSFFEEKFNRIFFDPNDNLFIYDVKSSCKNV